MKKRIQKIIFLALIANIGIVAFQIYWLRNTYQINEERFEKDVNEALATSVENLIADHFRRGLFEEYGGMQYTSKIIAPSTGMFTATDMDTSFSIAFINTEGTEVGEITTQRNIRIIGEEVSNTVPFSDSIRLEVDEIVNKALITLVDQNFEMERLDSLYQQELASREIHLPYYIDYYRLDSLYESTASKGHFEMAYQTKAVTNLLGSDAVIQAGFPSRTLFLFQKMSLTLLASLLLLAITTASFFYMIQIIFEQKKLSDIKNDFISNMTHELKTPISILSAANEAMTSFDILENRSKTQQYLSIFKNEIERLSNMVEKVLNIAIYEKTTFHLNLEATNIEELLESVAHRYQAVPHKDIEIDWESDLQQPILQLDKTHFNNILNNLMDNAIKYSKDQVQIAIQTFEDAKNVIIQVSDNGIGISKSHQEHIFDKFYRVPTGNLHSVKGFGLGLSYVKKMVEKHGGEIEVRSEMQSGSIFTIRLPK